MPLPKALHRLIRKSIIRRYGKEALVALGLSAGAGGLVGYQLGKKAGAETMTTSDTLMRLMRRASIQGAKKKEGSTGT